jgi:glycosyltransferase involved in cell wall biosynthesis
MHRKAVIPAWLGGKMYKGKRVSVVIPCHNEEVGIRITVADMPALVDEVVVVDNNCSDTTAEVARALGAHVVKEVRKGYGAAYKAGLNHATGDIIVTMDGDGTYPRSFIPVLLEIMFEEDWDFITCDRTGHREKGAGTFVRILGNSVLNWTMALLYWVRLRDSQSGMWIFKRSILPQFNIVSDGMAFSEELKIEAFTKRHLRCTELPIYYRARIGESKLNVWKDGTYNLLFMFRKRFGLVGRSDARPFSSMGAPVTPDDAR